MSSGIISEWNWSIYLFSTRTKIAKFVRNNVEVHSPPCSWGINVLNTQFWQTFYPQIDANFTLRMHQNSPTDTNKSKNFWAPPSGRGVLYPATSPAPTLVRRGSDLRLLQQGCFLLCQLPLLLFFLLKTLLHNSYGMFIRLHAFQEQPVVSKFAVVIY